MNLQKDFDYHLNENEQKQVEKLVPLHQAKIHLAFRANLNINDKIIQNCAVALSEHMITICTPGFLRKSLKLYDTYHLFEIKSVETISDDTAKIAFDDVTIYFTTNCCMRFIRNTLRNFILSNPSLPPGKRFKFKCHNTSFFPPFTPPLSPSQIFQFTYNAFCSYFDTTYFHQVPQYYHQLLTTGNCIFDLTKLPFNLIEVNLEDAADLKPITHALMYLPFVYGFSCCNFVRPDIVSAIAPLVEYNPSIRMIRIVDTGATQGCKEVAEAMLQNEHQSISYWDLSDNKLEDIDYFIDALKKYECSVKAILLDNCDLQNESVSHLFHNLDKNSYMYNIEEISLLGAEVDSEACEKFMTLIEDIADNFEEESADDENGEAEKLLEMQEDAAYKFTPKLKTLRLSRIYDAPGILSTLQQQGIQLVNLTIQDTTFSDAGALVLNDFIRSQTRLNTLNLDGCIISIDLIETILKTIAESGKIANITLSLGRMKLQGQRFTEVFNSICTYLPMKLEQLKLDGNDMFVDDLIFLTSRIGEFNILKSLSLSRNFSRTQAGLGLALTGLTNGKLEEIILQGDETHKIGSEIIQLLCFLQNSYLVHSLDISNNDINDVGLETLTNLVVVSKSLTRISIDSSNPANYDSIDKFITKIEKDPELIEFPLPFNDFYTCYDKEVSRQPELIKSFTSHQKTLDLTLNRNRAKAGLHSELTFLNDPTLNNILDISTIKLQRILDRCSLNQHLAITEIVGLPFPFEKAPTSTTSGTVLSAQNDAQGDGYVDPMMLSSISEGIDPAMDALKTLQFNSLLIRRPKAMAKFKANPSQFVPPSEQDVYSSDSDEYYDEESESSSDKKPAIDLTKLSIKPPTDFPENPIMAQLADVESAETQIEPSKELKPTSEMPTSLDL